VVVAVVFAKVVGLNLGIPPAVLERGPSGVSGLGRLKAFGVSGEAWLRNGGLFALLGFGDPAFGALEGGL
jgi:hypothetical protein